MRVSFYMNYYINTDQHCFCSQKTNNHYQYKLYLQAQCVIFALIIYTAYTFTYSVGHIVLPRHWISLRSGDLADNATRARTLCLKAQRFSSSRPFLDQ